MRPGGSQISNSKTGESVIRVSGDYGERTSKETVTLLQEEGRKKATVEAYKKIADENGESAMRLVEENLRLKNEVEKLKANSGKLLFRGHRC